MNFSKFLLFHPFKEFECIFCGAILKTGLIVRIFCITTFGVVLASFFFIFPIIEEIIGSHSSKMIRLIFRGFLPYIVIPFQVVILFTPVALFAWIWGKLKVVKLKTQNT